MNNCKRRRLDSVEDTEDRKINKLVDEVMSLRNDMKDLQKILKILTVQIKYQNNKITSLEDVISQKEESVDISHLTELLTNNKISTENENEIEVDTKSNFSYIS